MKTTRLYRLADKSADYAHFEATAIARSSWFIRPFILQGFNVNRPWLQAFYTAFINGRTL